MLDYGFEGGKLTLAHRDIRTGKRWQTETLGLDYPGTAQAPKVKAWLETSTTEDMLVSLKLIKAGGKRPARRLAIHFDTWTQVAMGDKARAFWQAQPDSDHLWVGQLGHEGSSRLPDSRIRQVAVSGSFDEYGKVFAAAVDKFLDYAKYDEISISGASIGGRFAISTAANLSHTLDNLMIIDAPGDRYMSGVAWLYVFSLTEGKRGAKYHKGGQNPSPRDWRAAVGFFRKTMSRKGGRGAVTERWIHYGNAVRKAGLIGDLELALARVWHFDIVTMEYSKFANSQHFEQRLAIDARQYDRQVWLHTVIGHSHAAFGPKRPFLEARIAENLAASHRSRQ